MGFVLIGGVSRRGHFLVRRKTRRDRMQGTLKRVKDELRRRMHWPIPEQGRWLRQVVTGFFAYHAVPTNSRALAAFRHHVSVLWKRALSRRSQKAYMTWKRMLRLVNDWLLAVASCILGPISGSTSNTQGGSRVPKSGLLGSERGARSDARPYRKCSEPVG